MTSDEVLGVFKKLSGYITNDHIVYTSGKHGETYLNKAVAAPALGGIILSQWTSYHLSEMTGVEVLGVYTEKTPDKNQIFTRGYDKLVKGKRVLIVEDITTTGGSVMKVIASVKSSGGEVVGVCVLANRNPDEINSKTLGFPYQSLAEIRMQAWDEKECPLCKKGVPINTTVGKGRDYLKSKGK